MAFPPLIQKLMISMRWRRRVAPEPPPVVADLSVLRIQFHCMHKLQKFASIVKSRVRKMGGISPGYNTHDAVHLALVIPLYFLLRFLCALCGLLGTIANARTGNDPKPFTFTGTAKKANPSSGKASRLQRCSTIGISALSRRVWAGRVPSAASSILNESIPTRTAP